MARLEIGRRLRQSQDDTLSDSPRGTWKTPRRTDSGVMTFGAKLTLGFALAATMTVVVLVGVLGYTWEYQFRQYALTNMQNVADNTADTLAAKYERAGELWTADVLSFASLSSAGAGSGVYVQVLNEDGTVIYDANWLTRDLVDKDGDGEVNATALHPKANDTVVDAKIVTASGKNVGTVRIWAPNSDAFLTSTDRTFKVNSYGAIASASVLAVLIACVIGSFVARNLARPIRSITSTARQIRNGDLSARSGIEGTDEIGQLGETFDEMATKVEKDIEAEHRLTSDVAHELRTPLMAMLATVEAMQDGVLPADEERLATVADETKRLSRLVDAMLAISRLENGTAPFNPQRTDVAGLVRGVVSSQEQLFSDAGLRLSFNCSVRGGEAWANVDRDMVRQAVINFMSNALRYTPKDGWVVVKVSQERSDVVISVSDTGIGIAKEDLAKVFGRFWRSDASRERASGGLGVGMALTKEIADRHKGFISVESELGRGSTFALHVPVNQKFDQDSPKHDAQVQ